MNVAYLILFEHLNDSIIRGQVIDLLKELRKHLQEIEKVYLISFLSLYWFLTHRKELNDLKEELKKANIRLVVIPVIHFVQMFYAKWYQIPLVFSQTFPLLFYFSATRNIRLFHCRSYPITLSALAVKKLRGVKVIFDPRSDFPEENVTAGQWTNNSLSYTLWKFLEKIYLDSADKTIAITKTYVSHFRNISQNAKFAIIPNNVDTKNFKHDENFRKQFRLENNIKDDEVLFCYCGSLGRKYWHNPEIYAKYIIKLREINIVHRFLFITPNIDMLKKVFDQFGIKSEEYFVIHSDFWDVPKYLSAADFGIIVMDRFDIRMSIKTAEYLSIGLPVIANSNVAGAKEIIKENGIGIVYDLDSTDLKGLKEFIQRRKRLSIKCRKVACKIFSNENIAKQYAKLYYNLLRKK